MLIPIQPQDHLRLSALFDAAYPNLAFVRAVLAGELPGQAWAQWEGTRPRACLITTGSPFCFIAGPMSSSLFAQALALLANKPSVMLVCAAAPDFAALAGQHGLRAAERVQFVAGPTELDPSELVVPAPYRLARIDAELFPHLLWSDMVLGIYGSAEFYLRHHHGFCLLHEGRIVAEAHGVVGGGLVEIGLFTHPEHRRRGLTTIVARRLIDHGARLGQRSVATCMQGKVESERALAAAGYVRAFDYHVLTRTAAGSSAGARS